MKSAKKGMQKSRKSTTATGKKPEGFTDEERVAGPWQLFREIDMVRGESESRIGVRTDDVFDAIEKGSAYVTSVRIQVTEEEPPRRP